MNRLRSLKVVVPAGLMAAILVVGEVSQAVAEGFLVAEENQMTDMVNGHRGAHGLPGLRLDPALQMVARRQAQRMVAAGYIYHNPNLRDESAQAIPDWLRLGENVGVGGNVPSVQEAFLNSPPHHANIDNQYNVIGLGAMAAGDGRLFFTQNYALQRGAAAPAPAPAQQAAPAAQAAPCRGRRCPRARRARAPRARRARVRRARVRGVELVRSATPGDRRVSGSGSITLPEALGGMLVHAGGKLTWWD